MLPPRNKIRLNQFYMNILKAIIATIIFSAAAFFISWLILGVLMVDLKWNSWPVLIIPTFVNTFLVFLFIWFVRTPGESIFQKTNYRWYLLAILLGASYIFIQTPLNLFYNFLFGTDYNILYDFDGLESLKLIKIICSVILAPLAEELFFRSYVQKTIGKSSHFAVAIVLSAFLFSLTHLQLETFFIDILDLNLTPHHMYLTFFGGLMSAYLYYKSKSVGPSIVMHMCWNLMAYLI